MGRALWVGGVLVALVAGCDGASSMPESTGAVASPIVFGTKSTAALDAVVRITYTDGGTCSGTLIAPNLVLTARHCITNLDTEQMDCGPIKTEIPPENMAVAVGLDAAETTVGVPAKAIYMDRQAGCGHDLGLLLLTKDIPNAKVARVRFTKVTLGEPVTTSGYGQDGVEGEPGVTGNNTDGRYDRKGLTIDFIGPGTQQYKLKNGGTLPFELEEGEIVTGEGTCFGDSGGPLFDKSGAVIGTTWRGTDDKCVDRPTSYSATSAHEALIMEAVKASGHTLAADPPPPVKETPKPASPKAGDDDDDDDDAPATKAEPEEKKRKKTVAPEPAGCSTGSHGTKRGAPSLGALGVMLAIVLCRRRSLRDRAL